MNAKKVVPLVAAVVLGLVAAWSVVQIAHSGNRIKMVMPSMTTAVIVGQNVPAGQTLTAEDVKLGFLPGNTQSVGTFTSVADAVGRVPLVPLVAGEALAEPLLAPKGSGAGLQVLIPPGMRALTVDIDEISGVAGYLTPGCHVDILTSIGAVNSGPNDQVTRAIVKNIQVLAVGQRALSADQPPQAVRSITLLVTPRQAEQIALASVVGSRPRMVLRNDKDTDVTDSQGVTLTDLRGGTSQHGPQLAIGPTTQPVPTVPVVYDQHDPFGTPTTQPTASADQNPTEWTVRVFTGGDSSLVTVKLPKPVPARTPQNNNNTISTSTQMEQSQTDQTPTVAP